VQLPISEDSLFDRVPNSNWWYFMNLKAVFTPRRLLVYIIGLALYAYGACLMAQASIGISPITSVPYLFTILTPGTLGLTQLIWTLILIFAQAVWLRRDFEKFQYFQIAASVIFSVFLDLLMPLAKVFASDVLILRILLCIASLIVMGIGLGTAVIADLVLIPGDGMARAIAHKTGWVFGKAKVLMDVSCVTITIILSTILLRRPFAVVQMGTVVSMLFLGNIVRIYSSFTSKALLRFMRMEGAEPAALGNPQKTESAQIEEADIEK